jgi:hypothetical protein
MTLAGRRGSWEASLQPRRGALTQPKPAAWVNEISSGFAKALKGVINPPNRLRRRAIVRPISPFRAIAGATLVVAPGWPQGPPLQRDFFTPPIGLSCAGVAPLGLNRRCPRVATRAAPTTRCFHALKGIPPKTASAATTAGSANCRGCAESRPGCPREGSKAVPRSKERNPHRCWACQSRFD